MPREEQALRGKVQEGAGGKQRRKRKADMSSSRGHDPPPACRGRQPRGVLPGAERNLPHRSRRSQRGWRAGGPGSASQSAAARRRPEAAVRRGARRDGSSALIRDRSLKEGLGKSQPIAVRSSPRGTGSPSALGSPTTSAPSSGGDTAASLPPEQRRGGGRLRPACDMGPGSLAQLLQPWVVLSPAPAGSRSHQQLSCCPRGEMLPFAGACAVCPLKPLRPNPFGCRRVSFPWPCLQKTLTQKEIGVFVPLVLQLAGHPAATHCHLSKEHAHHAGAPGHEKQQEGCRQASNFLGCKK